MCSVVTIINNTTYLKVAKSRFKSSYHTKSSCVTREVTNGV